MIVNSALRSGIVTYPGGLMLSLFKPADPTARLEGSTKPAAASTRLHPVTQTQFTSGNLRLASDGYTAEASAVNEVSSPTDWTTGVSKAAITSIVHSSTELSPYGGYAEEITDANTTSGAHFFYKTSGMSTDDSVDCILTFTVKQKTTDRNVWLYLSNPTNTSYLSVQYNFATNTFTASPVSAGNTLTSAESILLTGVWSGWVRVVLKGHLSALGGVAYGRLLRSSDQASTYAGTVGSGIYLAGATITNAAIKPTSFTSGTRADDRGLSVPIGRISTVKGSMTGKITAYNLPGANQAVIALNGGTGAEFLYINSSNQLCMTDGTNTVTGGTLTRNTTHTFGAFWETGGNFNLKVDGVPATQQVYSGFPAGSNIEFLKATDYGVTLGELDVYNQVFF